MGGSNSETEFEIEFFKKIIKNDNIVFDVGARDSNIPYINDNTTYHLFEPVEFNIENLEKKFNSKNNVKINKFCLSDIEESTKIYVESESINKRTDFNYVWDKVNPSRVKNGNTEEIKCITLKKYIEENRIEKIDLLKIDVEGYEYKVIKGLYEYLDIVNCIIFEYSIGTYNSSNTNLLEVLNLLSGYKFYILTNNDDIFKELHGSNELIYEKLKNNSNCNIIAVKNGQHIF